MFTLTFHQAGGRHEINSYPTLEEASKALRDWQDKHGIGISQVGRFHGRVLNGDMHHLKISYNGCVWDGVELVYDPAG